MFPNESKYLKRGYASRDEQRLRRRSYRKLVKATIKKMLPILSVKLQLGRVDIYTLKPEARKNRGSLCVVKNSYGIMIL